MCNCIKTIILLLLVFGVSEQAFTESVRLDRRVYKRAIVNSGDMTRLKKAMQKASNGGTFVVGTIGGSITQGAVASSPEKNWSSLVAKWWKESFPKAKVKLVNAGIGATGSLIGAHRAYRDLLKQKPDIVICEYSVNDANDQLSAETLEGLVRQSLNSKKRPPVILLFTMDINGGNAQEWHSKVGYHYKLPMISARDALVPEIKAGRMQWTDVLGDVVHPNDAGHKYYADFITYLLDTTRSEMDFNEETPGISRLPKPLISSIFEHTSIYNYDNLKPAVNNGWESGDAWGFGKCWKTDKAGSVLEFEIAGDTISILYFRLKSDMGIAEASVDNQAPVKLDAWFDQDWGGYSAFAILGRNLGPDKHKVRIKIIDDKAPASNGHRFELHGVLTAGK